MFLFAVLFLPILTAVAQSTPESESAAAESGQTTVPREIDDPAEAGSDGAISGSDGAIAEETGGSGSLLAFYVIKNTVRSACERAARGNRSRPSRARQPSLSRILQEDELALAEV